MPRFYKFCHRNTEGTENIFHNRLIKSSLVTVLRWSGFAMPVLYIFATETQKARKNTVSTKFCESSLVTVFRLSGFAMATLAPNRVFKPDCSDIRQFFTGDLA